MNNMLDKTKQHECTFFEAFDYKSNTSDLNLRISFADDVDLGTANQYTKLTNLYINENGVLPQYWYDDVKYASIISNKYLDLTFNTNSDFFTFNFTYSANLVNYPLFPSLNINRTNITNMELIIYLTPELCETFYDSVIFLIKSTSPGAKPYLNLNTSALLPDPDNKQSFKNLTYFDNNIIKIYKICDIIDLNPDVNETIYNYYIGVIKFKDLNIVSSTEFIDTGNGGWTKADVTPTLLSTYFNSALNNIETVKNAKYSEFDYIVYDAIRPNSDADISGYIYNIQHVLEFTWAELLSYTFIASPNRNYANFNKFTVHIGNDYPASSSSSFDLGHIKFLEAYIYDIACFDTLPETIEVNRKIGDEWDGWTECKSLKYENGNVTEYDLAGPKLMTLHKNSVDSSEMITMWVRNHRRRSCGGELYIIWRL